MSLFMWQSLQAADFSIKATGGFKYSLFKDVNSGIMGYLGVWADGLTSSGGIVTDRTEPLHFCSDYSVDFILSLDSPYGLALGVGYVRAKNRSEIFVRYSDGRPETSALVETTIEAVPIRLSVFRDFQLTRALNAYIMGGLEIYPTQFQSSSWPAGPGDSHRQKARSVGIGLLYGAGLEIKILAHVALVLEAQGNYARIANLKGTRKSGGSSLPHEVKGTLYYDELTFYFPPDIQKTYAQLMISESMPSGDRARPGRVNFSGFALSGGIRIYL